MKPDVLDKSICSTCNELEKCFWNNSGPEAKVYCEEFDSYMNIQKNFSEDKEKTFINDEKIDLHMNCDNKTICMYRNDNTMKMYCEEHL
ncbi:MAG: hypothetical protein PHD97_08980 [Bacteroidales bacterium]|nr:hypothetical protein [Bacteroidales bacterium]